jgi:O-antigen/teichoic acid export membrane protein
MAFAEAHTSRLLDFLQGPVLRQYLSALSGAVGRLVFSLIYFIALANSLGIAGFGVFATASAMGVVLSRIISFGFVSPLYRVATVKPHLLGVYTAGFFGMVVASLPVFAAASIALFAVGFHGEITWFAFALIVCAEALLWRTSEVIVIVNYGTGRFLHGSVLVIVGTAIRAGAAIAFWLQGQTSLDIWAEHYVAANVISLLIGGVFFFPWRKMRWRPRLYLRRLPDALYVSAAEILFYVQMELDKLVVLSFGGAHMAGIYAIVMRLADLTAIPIRSFNIMLVQKLMKTPQWLNSLWRRLGIELGVFIVSAAGLATLGGMLWFKPDLLGENVAEAAALVVLAIAVPGFRNLVEYQAELLYARGQTGLRTINFALLAAAKAVILVWILARSGGDDASLVISLNWGFALLYAISLCLTYPALKLPAKRI